MLMYVTIINYYLELDENINGKIVKYIYHRIKYIYPIRSASMIENMKH